MKSIFIFSVLFAVGACQLVTTHGKRSVTGIYTTGFNDSNWIVKDTFYIRFLTNSKSDQLVVVNSGSSQQVVNRHVKPIRTNINRWTGTYNSKGHTIIINETGAVIGFDSETGNMNLGTVTYKKVRK